ncbi:flavin monoamine oxidase family protein [Alteromonas sp. CYL-A6]|uniref:flavin monoamine oxidase family protein n=1 Tax=Alteromonas nitratireducens TaxID=3390813 RepID=UPI0034A9D29F
MGQGITRRQYLMLMAKLAGGSAALFQVARAFGITPVSSVFTPSKLKAVSGKPPKVVLLGAGISALVCAYELSRAGYDCQILEASHRIGGRNLTLRHGDKIDELGNPQICQFDDEPHLYFNAGPARLPAEHEGILHYCRELGVELQLFCNYNRNCYCQDDKAFDGQPIRIREYEADVRGFMSELMAKSMQPDDLLDAPFDDVDFDKMVEFVKRFGSLDEEGRYKGSESAGFASIDVLSPLRLKDPRRFADLLKSDFWAGAMHFIDIADQSPAMMTPKGGMDSIVRHFLPHIEHLVTLHALVQRIETSDDQVTVSYLHNGEPKQITADYCLNCIPMQIMAGIDSNLPEDYKSIMRMVHRGKLFKVGLQARERFWEQEQIYAGISWTNQDITQIWYPEHGTFQKKGVLLGGYSWENPIVERISAMSPAQRINYAITQGEKLHPNYRQYIETGVSICWNRMNHLMGCGTYWPPEVYEKHYERLRAPAGRHYLMGDQMATIQGWQEGAVQSAWYVLRDIEARQIATQGRPV